MPSPCGSNAPMKALGCLELVRGYWANANRTPLKTDRRFTNIGRLAAVEFHSLRLIVFSHFPKDGGHAFVCCTPRMTSANCQHRQARPNCSYRSLRECFGENFSVHASHKGVGFSAAVTCRCVAIASPSPSGTGHAGRAEVDSARSPSSQTPLPALLCAACPSEAMPIGE